MGGQEALNMIQEASASKAQHLADEYQGWRRDLARMAMRDGKPVDLTEQLRLMNLLVTIADELAIAVLDER